MYRAAFVTREMSLIELSMQQLPSIMPHGFDSAPPQWRALTRIALPVILRLASLLCGRR
jgi:hypothetical protein